MYFHTSMDKLTSTSKSYTQLVNESRSFVFQQTERVLCAYGECTTYILIGLLLTHQLQFIAPIAALLLLFPDTNDNIKV